MEYPDHITANNLLIHHTYDVFVRCGKNGHGILDTKFERRDNSRIMTDVVLDSDGFIERWCHPDDRDFVFAGTIAAPLAWIKGAINGDD